MLAHRPAPALTRSPVRIFANLLASVSLLGSVGCVGSIGDTPANYKDPNSDSQTISSDGGRTNTRDATTKSDAAVVADTPTQIGGDDNTDGSGDDGTPPPTPVVQDAADAATNPPPADDNLCPDTQQEPLATGLHIDEIALYQTVKVSLYNNGAWVTQRTAPVVQNKKSLVRVFVSPTSGYQARNLRGVLTLSDGKNSMQLTDQRMLTAASTEDQITSTFSFQVDPAQVGPDTQFSVSIQELACGSDTGNAADVRYPTSGVTALQAEAIGNLTVVVVPVNINGRLPITTDAEIANIRAALLAYYPVPGVDVTVRAPLTWTEAIDPLDGQTWSDLLNGIMSERRKDAPASNVYYFGLMQPAATFRAYCPKGCILGLAPQTTSIQTSAQIGLGASFGDGQTYETMVHELGHAHGRGHAPCVEAGEIDGVDPKFPDKTGAIVTWGWDSRNNTLMPPADKDIMGYCEPNWISTYNYALNATRSEQVNLLKEVANVKEAEQWQLVLLYGNGGARWGGSTETLKPGGTSETADVLDAQGNVIAQTEIVRIALSNGADQFIYVQTPEVGWAALKLSDRTVTLSAIKPAL